MALSDLACCSVPELMSTSPTAARGSQAPAPTLKEQEHVPASLTRRQLLGTLVLRSLPVIPRLAARWHPSAPGRASSSLGSDLRAIRLEERLTAPESLVAGSQKTEGRNVPLGSMTKVSEGVRYNEPVKSERKLLPKIALQSQLGQQERTASG